MEAVMKNKFTFVLTVLFLFLAVPATAAAAEANSGTLTADKNNVTVSLHIPAAGAEGSVSLRLQLRVSAISGTMGKPAFVFDGAVKSTVRDAGIRQEKNGSYLVDIIVSGKEDQKLFSNSGDVRLGVLSVASTSQDYQIKVEFAGETGGVPSVTYVDGEGLHSVTVPLSKADAVIVKPAGIRPTQSPDQTPSPSSKESRAAVSFGKKPKLTASVKNGSNRVTLKWTKDEGADGYVLFRYNTSKKKYVRAKTFSGAKTISYSKKYSYGKRYSFKLRAYRTAAGGTKTYGSFSTAAKVKLPPAKVKGVSVKSGGYLKTVLSWNKVSRAKGYQIFGSREKNGEYARVKTIHTGKKNSIVIDQKDSGICYYKIRAYVKGIKKKRVYGKFSASKAANNLR